MLKYRWLIAIVAVVLVTAGVAVAARGPHYGDYTTAGQVQLSDGSGNWLTLLTGSLSSDVDCYLPTIAAAFGDTGVVHATGSGVLATDTTNFVWDDTANAQYLKLGAGTGGGTVTLLEGSGGGTNTVSVTAPATLAGNIEFTLPNALPTTSGNFLAVSTTGALSSGPAQRVLYSALSASAAHDGTVTAETAVMPATAEGNAATDIADANLGTGAALPWNVFVAATGDADGDETLTVNVYFGAQLVGTSGAINIDGPTEFFLTGSVKIRTTGAAGAGIYECVSHNGAATVAMDGATFSSFDTTGTNAFAVKLDWGGTTDAADSATVEDATLYVNNFD